MLPLLALFAAHPHPLARALVFILFIGIVATFIATRVFRRQQRRVELDQRLKSLEEKIDRLATGQAPINK